MKILLLFWNTMLFDPPDAIFKDNDVWYQTMMFDIIKFSARGDVNKKLSQKQSGTGCVTKWWYRLDENLCFSGTNQKPERPRPFGTGLVRHCPQGLFSPFFAFLRALLSRPFRLSLALTICPWVSEDGGNRFWFELSGVDCMFKTRYSKG